MTIYLDSLYRTIVRTSKFLTNHKILQQTRFMSLVETFTEGLIFVTDCTTVYCKNTRWLLSHPNVGFLQGFAPATQQCVPAGGGTSAGDGTCASIGAKQCTTPVSNPLLCARICYLTASTRTSLGFVFNTDYQCMMVV